MGILAGEHGKTRGLAAEQLGGLAGVGAAILEAGDIGMLRQAQQRFIAQVDAGSIRDVVDQDRPVGRVRQRGEMAVEPFLRGPRVVRAGDEIAIDGPGSGPRQHLQQLRRIAAGESEIERTPALDLLGGQGDEPLGLCLVEGHSLAGGGPQDKAIHALAEIMPQQPDERDLVEAALLEGRHQRQPESGYPRSYVFHVPLLRLAGGREPEMKRPRPDRRGPSMILQERLSARAIPRLPRCRRLWI